MLALKVEIQPAYECTTGSDNAINILLFITSCIVHVDHHHNLTKFILLTKSSLICEYYSMSVQL